MHTRIIEKDALVALHLLTELIRKKTAVGVHIKQVHIVVSHEVDYIDEIGGDDSQTMRMLQTACAGIRERSTGPRGERCLLVSVCAQITKNEPSYRWDARVIARMLRTAAGLTVYSKGGKTWLDLNDKFRAFILPVLEARIKRSPIPAVGEGQHEDFH